MAPICSVIGRNVSDTLRSTVATASAMLLVSTAGFESEARTLNVCDGHVASACASGR